MPGTVITRFGFDVGPVLRWIEAVRERGIGLPVPVGVPGPAGVRRLLSYAARFGVSLPAGSRAGASGGAGGAHRAHHLSRPP